MIDLTPLEVRQKKDDLRRGARSLRGYAPGDVDTFLDLVAERMEQLVRENMAMADRLAVLETELREYREREKGLTEALVAAQEIREEVRSQAMRDAELLRREAELDAARVQLASAEAREREEAALRRLRARRTQLLASYRTFLERELAELAVVAEVIQSEAERGPETPETMPEQPRQRGKAAQAVSPPGEGEQPPAEPEGGAAGDDEEATEEPGDWLSALLKEEQ